MAIMTRLIISPSTPPVNDSITVSSMIILNTLINSREHLSPAAIYERVRKEDPDIGLVTVYRTLGILAELGLVCEVHLADGSHGYIGRPAEHHDHLICSECGKVVNFTRCNVSDLERRLSSETGFTIGEHHLEFYGTCRECTKAGTGAD